MVEKLERAEESLCDHELLEMVLFNAIPRKNTNDIAHRLLLKFGSIKGVFRADVAQLSAVDGVGESTAAYLRCIGLFMERMNHVKEKGSPSLGCFDDFVKVLLERFEGVKSEIMELYSLDAFEHAKNVRRYTSAERGSVKLKNDDVIDFILREKPTSMLIVHNHLTGDSTPSTADNEFTAQVYMICQIHGVKLREHVILSSTGVYSYYLSGHLERIKDQYDMLSLIKERKI